MGKIGEVPDKHRNVAGGDLGAPQNLKSPKDTSPERSNTSNDSDKLESDKNENRRKAS